MIGGQTTNRTQAYVNLSYSVVSTPPTRAHKARAPHRRIRTVTLRHTAPVEQAKVRFALGVATHHKHPTGKDNPVECNRGGAETRRTDAEQQRHRTTDADRFARRSSRSLAITAARAATRFRSSRDFLCRAFAFSCSRDVLLT